MAEIFPPTIEKCFLLADYTQQAEPNVIRSDVEVGPAKIRARYTKPIVNVKASMKLDHAQLNTFEQFFRITLQSGVRRFLFPDPVTNTEREYRFIDPPVYQPLTDKYWMAEMSLEIMP